MNRKWFSLLLSLLFISTLLVGNPVVSAQEIVQPEFPTYKNQTPYYYPKTISSPLSTKATTVVGEPGTVFRYENTIGVTGEPYPSDGDHLNTPSGLFIDSSDNLFVTEIWHDRMLKFNSDGTNQLIIGFPGQPWHHDTFLSSPRDVDVDAEGNIWVVTINALKKFDSDGNFLQIFPSDNPWDPGQDNYHFDTPQGIAFDSTGKMYIADSGNQRIQIYEIDGENINYLATIGLTGEIRSDHEGFNWPHRVVFDYLGRLYVADEGNSRIQRCTFGTEWTCDTFFGVSGVYGSDQTHLGWAYGLDVKGDKVYIADTSNYRVLECSLEGICSLFVGVTGESGTDNDHFDWVTDVAVDSQGNVYTADEGLHNVKIFDSGGEFIGMRGETLVPYAPDMIRLNEPSGIMTTEDGGLLVLEGGGNRIIKYNSSYTQVWTYGTAGVWLGENNLNGPSGNIAQDNSGNIYFADTWNSYVVILSKDGNYLGGLGNKWWSGDDNDHFELPQGVAISPTNQDIFVVDSGNQRIQVFDKNRFYKATIGVTDEIGSDNSHFDNPVGIAIDLLGNIYVADQWNYRVQKCQPSGVSYTCSTFVGETGVFDNQFNHFFPTSVTVDQLGNVYVTDDWNTRVQVYDKDGHYFTTIGGIWGSLNSQFISPRAVAVDLEGNVFVTDLLNHRIQKFAPGYPNWEQVNINGFGDRRVEMIPSMVVFNDFLYAGTWFYDGEKENSQIWRSADSKNWELVGSEFGVGVSHMIEFNDKLYAGTWDGNLFSSEDGKNWIPITDPGLETGIARFEVYNGSLYLSTWNEITGTQIWRTENGLSWTKMSGGFERLNNNGAISSEVFNGNLYYGVYNWIDGAELWRFNGSTWAKVFDKGLGDTNNVAISALAEFQGKLYAGMWNETGLQVFSSINGSDWVSSIESGLDTPNILRECSLEVIGDTLYLVVQNDVTGLEVWKTVDGKNWVQIAEKGFGDSNNIWSYYDSATVSFMNKLFVGVINWANGGEVWSYDTQKYIFLPLVIK